MKEIQKNINKVYSDIFNYTPQTERLEDCFKQCLKLMRNNDIPKLKENTGNLLSSLIQFCNESEWDVEDVINESLNIILERREQYRTLGRKKKIALYGGAFNPCTNAHLEVAKFVLDASGKFDEVWFVPTYKHMYNKEMASPEQRIEMCKMMIKNDGRLKIFDYEIRKQLSGETYKFVKELLNDKEFINYDFAIIIGQDNANTFNKWVNYEHLEKLIPFVVVPRKGVERDLNVDWYLKSPHIYLRDENKIQAISSTEIRTAVKNNIEDFLNKHVQADVLKYIKENKLYEN